MRLRDPLSSNMCDLSLQKVTQVQMPTARLWLNFSSLTKELTRHRSGLSLSTVASITGHAP